MRRDAPLKAAKAYEDALNNALLNDDEDEDEDMLDYEGYGDENNVKHNDTDQEQRRKDEQRKDMDRIQNLLRKHPEWLLQPPEATSQEQERWRDGEMSDVYARSLETLFRLQGEGSGIGYEDEEEDGSSYSGSAPLARTVGKVERARLATGVVEKM